jgi:hypothetical protein
MYCSLRNQTLQMEIFLKIITDINKSNKNYNQIYYSFRYQVFTNGNIIKDDFTNEQF